MSETNDLQRMRELIVKLNEASRRYYDQNESDISDDEWDAMYAELRGLEEKTGERMADSPTRRVGGAVMEGFEQHRHIARLWSMDKAQSEEEILAWAQRCEKQTNDAGGLPKNSYCVEYKLDGLTVNLTYDGGKLVQAATRGNGEVGEAILPQAMTIRTIPLTIPFTGRMEVQGEGDAIVFTAGIGENAIPVREKVVSYLGYLGVTLDKEANGVRGEEIVISTPDSKVKVAVIPTNEELAICRETVALV